MLEVLEAFYRVHASVIKYVLHHEAIDEHELVVMETHVHQLASGPFATRRQDDVPTSSKRTGKRYKTHVFLYSYLAT